MYHEVRTEITFQFTNFKGEAVDVWEWIKNSSRSLLAMWSLIPAGIKFDQI